MQAGSGLLATTAKVLTKSLAEGFKLAESEPSKELVSKLTQDVWVFSGFKTHAQLSEVSQHLFQDGKVRPWAKFKNDVLDKHPKYNTNYLEAEYHHAVGSSQMAAKWEKFEREKDRYQLRYRATRDKNTRASHAGMHGITLPVDDPFWDKFLPPNGWRCRCGVTQVKLSEKSTDPKKAMQRGEAATMQENMHGDNALEMFRFNSGKEKVVFPKHHPYKRTGFKEGEGGEKQRKQVEIEAISQIYGQEKNLKDAINRIADAEHEHAYVFDKNGRKITYLTDADMYISMPDGWYDENSPTVGAVMLHNHPTVLEGVARVNRPIGIPFSYDDIESACDARFKRLVLYSREGNKVYSLEPRDGNFNQELLLKEVGENDMETFYAKQYLDFFAEYQNSGLSDFVIERVVRHEVVTNLADIFDLIFNTYEKEEFVRQR